MIETHKSKPINTMAKLIKVFLLVPAVHDLGQNPVVTEMHIEIGIISTKLIKIINQ